LEKAKAIKGDVDKIINKAKRGDEKLATQLLQRSVGINEVKKVIKDLAPRLKDRTSGYTRIIKLGKRFSDNAEMVLMEWVIKKEIKVEKLADKGSVKGLPAGKVEEKPKTEKKAKKVEKKETKGKVAKKK
jgi:large subunit ribosomal protein L17